MSERPRIVTAWLIGVLALVALDMRWTLWGIALFAPQNLIRAAKLFYDDGRDEIVLVPMLYGLTWAMGNA